MPKKPTPQQNKKLIFKKCYKNYEEFYDDTKTEIYKSILELFKAFKDKRKKTQSLGISAIIKDEKWNSELVFKRDEHIVLKRDLMPYFENLEEFEICSEINSLYKEFTN
jgi:hypothetical protein